jgi:hypothetical protein
MRYPDPSFLLPVSLALLIHAGGGRYPEENGERKH